MQREEDFRKLYNEFNVLVYNLALHYVQNPEDAADITQESFIRIHQHLHRHNPEQASLKTWISRITINQCLDFLRKKKSKKRFGFLQSLFSGTEKEPEAAIQVNHPGIITEHKEELQSLLSMINELPENQRTALILMKIEERSQKETAEIMQTSPKAVESLLQRARQNLEKKWNSRKGLPGK